MLYKTFKRLFQKQPNTRNIRALGGRISMQHPYRAHTISSIAPPDSTQAIWQRNN